VRSTLAGAAAGLGAAGRPVDSELLNIFIQSADEWLEPPSEASLHLGRASVLAEQPEFQSGSGSRG
jgi:heat-inducible transcriptional repressor